MDRGLHAFVCNDEKLKLQAWDFKFVRFCCTNAMMRIPLLYNVCSTAGAGIAAEGGTARCRAAEDADVAASGRAERQGLSDYITYRWRKLELRQAGVRLNHKSVYGLAPVGVQPTSYNRRLILTGEKSQVGLGMGEEGMALRGWPDRKPCRS